MDIHEKVPFDWAAAETLNLSTTILIVTLEDTASQRAQLRHTALEDFSGYFATVFAENGIADASDTDELCTALRGVTSALSTLTEAARLEEHRRIAAREEEAARSCEYDPVLSPTAQSLDLSSVPWRGSGGICTVPPPQERLTLAIDATLRPRGFTLTTHGAPSSRSSARTETLAAFVSGGRDLTTTTASQAARWNTDLESFCSGTQWGSLDASGVSAALHEYLHECELELDWVDAIRELFDVSGASEAGISSLSNAEIFSARFVTRGMASALSSGLLGTASSQGVARWFSGLSQFHQRSLIELNPDSMRNLDGIPSHTRDQLNREFLATRLSELYDLRASGAPYDSTELEDLAAVSSTLARADSYTSERNEAPSFLLTLDTQGSHIKAALSYGDVESADYVQVFVPGFSTTVGSDLSSSFERMRELNSVSNSLLLANAHHDSVASVAWLGYDAPQWSNTFTADSVALSGAAHAGSSRLTAFTAGLQANRDTPPQISLIGHSYGSVVSLLAVQDPTNVASRVIAMGSPGLPSATADVNILENLAFSDTGSALIDAAALATGPLAPTVKGVHEGSVALYGAATSESTASFYLDEGRIYHLEAPLDPIDDLAYFGSDLSDESSVVSMSTGESGVGHGIFFHSSYLEDKSTSQHNVAAASVGLDSLIIEENMSGLGDQLLDFNPREISPEYAGGNR